jgi:hypothetical protein
MPLIPAMWGLYSWGITVHGDPSIKQGLISKITNTKRAGIATQEQRSGSWLEAQPKANGSRDPISKNTVQSRVSRVAQLVQHLPCKSEVLSSNFSTIKKIKTHYEILKAHKYHKHEIQKT